MVGPNTTGKDSLVPGFLEDGGTIEGNSHFKDLPCEDSWHGESTHETVFTLRNGHSGIGFSGRNSRGYCMSGECFRRNMKKALFEGMTREAYDFVSEGQIGDVLKEEGAKGVPRNSGMQTLRGGSGPRAVGNAQIVAWESEKCVQGSVGGHEAREGRAMRVRDFLETAGDQQGGRRPMRGGKGD